MNRKHLFIACMISLVSILTACGNDTAESTIVEDDNLKEIEQNIENTENSSDGSYKDGTYTGTGTGHVSDIVAEVTILDGQITKIEIIEEYEDRPYYNNALVCLDVMIEEQTYLVDSVSGATATCVGMRSAVKNALALAN